MKRYLLALLILLLTGSGCKTASDLLGSTEASYENGKWYYKSNKNNENFDGKLGTDDQGRPVVSIKTTATTPESAIAAASQANAEAWKNISEVLKELLPLVKKGAAAGS